MGDDVEQLQRFFSEEFAAAAHAFFLWKGINNYAVGDRSIYLGINQNALTWNIITHSLQTTFFIVLGRLFDTDSDALSAHTLLRKCIDNIQQFDRQALRARKIAAWNGQEPSWLDGYTRDTYEPSIQDFLRLRGELSRHQARYSEIYRPIRNQIYAHREVATLEAVEPLFGRTRIGDIEELLNFLYQLKEVVWQLIHNGQLKALSDFNCPEEGYVLEDVRELLERVRSPEDPDAA